MSAVACLVTSCKHAARDDAPLCDVHWNALAAPLQRAVLAKCHGFASDDQLARIASACGGEIVAVRPLRTDSSSGERE